MTTKQFDAVVDNYIKHCRDTLCAKAAEYATEDRLHNFKVAAGLQHCTPIQALAGMMAKHTVSVYDMCRDSGNVFFPPNAWQEKIGDSINYLLLLAALALEEADKEAEACEKVGWEEE